MFSLSNDRSVVLDDDATGIAPYHSAGLCFPFAILCRNTAVESLNWNASALVVDCPPHILALQGQGFVEVIKESHGLPSCPTQPMPA
jgi:hypothetical protein